MEIFILEDDIKVFCIKATSFPDKVLEAHQSLHQLVNFNKERKYFGLSRPDNNVTIIYKAAAEEINIGELSKHKLEEYNIPKGKYLSIVVQDFMKDIPAIEKAFKI